MRISWDNRPPISVWPEVSSDVGQEIDLALNYLVDRHLTIQGRYSHFFAGDYFTDTSGSSADEDIDWLYFQATYKF